MQIIIFIFNLTYLIPGLKTEETNTITREDQELDSFVWQAIQAQRKYRDPPCYFTVCRSNPPMETSSSARSFVSRDNGGDQSVKWRWQISQVGTSPVRGVNVG